MVNWDFFTQIKISSDKPRAKHASFAKRLNTQSDIYTLEEEYSHVLLKVSWIKQAK